MAWAGSPEQPVSPLGWDPLTQLLNIGLDLRAWYPHWAQEHPPDENPLPLHSGLPHVAEWTRYLVGAAKKALEGCILVEVEAEREYIVAAEHGAPLPGISISAVGRAAQGTLVKKKLYTRHDHDEGEFPIELGRALAAELGIPFHPPPHMGR